MPPIVKETIARLCSNFLTCTAEWATLPRRPSAWIARLMSMPTNPATRSVWKCCAARLTKNRFKAIASRFTSMAKTASEPAKTEGPTLGAAALQDLMLQAEILVQYGMRTKAIERLQRIQELFPREEERNQDLQQLYLAAGMTPHRAESAPLPPAAEAISGVVKASPLPAKTPAPAESPDVNSFTKVADITRKLYRQTNADAVMSTAVAEIGAQWKISRCIVATRKPGMVPSAIKEYHSENVQGWRSQRL